MEKNNYILINNINKFTFDICLRKKINKYKDNEGIIIDFKIENKYFNYGIKTDLLTKKELINLIDVLEHFKFADSKEECIDKKIDFINSDMSIELWNDVNYKEIIISIMIRDNGNYYGDYYSLEINNSDIAKFVELLRRQIID